jgi:hypothetical protein
LVGQGGIATWESTCNRVAEPESLTGDVEGVKAIRGLRLTKLTLIIPDKYDLALSKAVRGYPHDLEAIQA